MRLAGYSVRDVESGLDERLPDGLSARRDPYDDPAESGTIIYSEWFFATTVGHTIILNVPTANGIFVGYDGTATNLSVTVAYR